MFKYYAIDSFNLQVGPQISFGLDKSNRSAVGLDIGAGLGYDFNKHFFVEGRYNYEMTNRSNFNGIKTKYNNFTIGLGFKF